MAVPRRRGRRRARPAVPRQRAAVGALRARLRTRRLVRPLLRSLAGVAAQTEADAARFEALGARDVAVTGNLKFDLGVPDGARGLASRMRATFGASRPVVLAASTRDGEEAAILDALARTPLADSTLLVIVPRHPQRFDDVAAMLAARGIAHARRSQNRPVPADVRVVLGDSMGEMAGYYGAADVAFVGGSLVPLGGQNLIEAIAMGAPASSARIRSTSRMRRTGRLPPAPRCASPMPMRCSPPLPRSSPTPRDARRCAHAPKASWPRTAVRPSAPGRTSQRGCRLRDPSGSVGRPSSPAAG